MLFSYIAPAIIHFFAAHCRAKRGGHAAGRYTETGFLVNEAAVEGALLCLRDLWVRWSPITVAEITPASLSMLLLLRPLPGELLRAPYIAVARSNLKP